MLIYEQFFETTSAKLIEDIKGVGESIGLTVHAFDTSHVVFTDGHFYYSYLYSSNNIYESYSTNDQYTGNYLTDNIFYKQISAYTSPNYKILMAAWKNGDDFGIGAYQQGYTLYACPTKLSRLATTKDRNVYMLNGDSTPVYYEEDGTSLGTYGNQIAQLTMNEMNTLYKRNLNVTGAGSVIIDNEYFYNAYNVCLPNSMTDRKYEVVMDDGKYFFPNNSMGSQLNMLFKHEEV